jgi:putative flippase GtrA
MDWRRERTRFAASWWWGAIGAVVDFGVFNLLSVPLRVNAIVASVLSFTAAVTSNFTFNRYWTYPDSRSKPMARQWVQFALVNLVGLFVRTPLFAALRAPWTRLAERLPMPWLPMSPQQLGNNLALACAVGVVLIWNFIANRFWTYNDVR